MKLVGYINGIEVRFDFYPPNQFKAEIPKRMSGIYLLELHAIDDAGNQSNMCDMAVLIDFDKLTFKVLDSEFIHETNNEEFGYKELQPEFLYKELV
ncbi:PF13754 domain-containing protein [Clostridium magnum]|uniref:Uncharacterized protein n=1 Tax=Clostridium magnum DSM 2767 TaxID=1121326 RepID=A0A161X264_9CLOT|nr:PF13754 domain-containing protein [Clostridium magnum]KZL93568.1 hypothetical protein CLMAG_06140 [Clostridium magnum DSM 2767]SHI60045.1 hypothetical protein SAMN02745944_04562 [Clostridium magnum DSM 2767]